MRRDQGGEKIYSNTSKSSALESVNNAVREQSTKRIFVQRVKDSVYIGRLRIVL